MIALALRGARDSIDTPPWNRSSSERMKHLALLTLVAFVSIGAAPAADDFRQLVKIEPLPTSLDRDFEFRKTKQYLLSDTAVPTKGLSIGKGTVRDPSIAFERSYRLFGAVTALDQRSRYGDYFDFFWRVRRPASVTVRLEYRTEKLRANTQAREVTYANAKGSHKTAFAVIGDDFFADGRIVAWRCSMIEKGRIVAQTRSYLWE